MHRHLSRAPAHSITATSTKVRLLPMALICIPSPAPVVAAIAPVAAAPPSELPAVNRAAFSILKHLLLSIRTPRVNAQRLHMPMLRVHAKAVIAHPEHPVRPR